MITHTTGSSVKPEISTGHPTRAEGSNPFVSRGQVTNRNLVRIQATAM